MRLYIDGAVVSPLAISKTIATSPEPLRMGHWATEWFAGILDEFRLYPRALTAAEIAAPASGSALTVQFSHADHLAGVPSLVEGGHRSPHEGMERPVMLTIRLLRIDPASLIPRIFPLLLGITSLPLWSRSPRV